MSSIEGAAEPTRLRKNALGAWYLGGMAMAWMGLAVATYFVIPFMEQVAGPITPLIFLLLIVLMLPTAVSYALLNGRRPSAGGAFTWLWEALSPPVGLWLGWLVFTLYGIIGVVLQPMIGGLTFNAILQLFNVHTGFLTGLVGAWITVAAVAAVTFTGMRRSARTVFLFLLLEAGFVLFLALFIIFDQAHHSQLSLAPLTPSRLQGGFEGFKIALIFGVFSIAGFDIVATAAEETRSAKTLVPRVTIWITILAGLFWAVTSYALAVAVPIKQMDAYIASATQSGAVYSVAGKFLGDGKVLVIITSVSAILAIMSSVMIAAARMLYALARDGFAPKWFAKLSPKHETPINAQIAMIGLAVVLPPILAVWQGHSLTNAYGWLGEVYVFFVLTPYLFVNIGNIVYHWRYHRADFNWGLHLAVPAIGIAIDGWILYVAFFEAYISLPFTGPSGIGSSIVWFALIWGAVGILWSLWHVWRRKGVPMPLLFNAEQAETAAEGLAESLKVSEAGAIGAPSAPLSSIDSVEGDPGSS